MDVNDGSTPRRVQDERRARRRREAYRFQTFDQRPGEARELHVTDLTLAELVTLMRLGMRPALLRP